MIIKNWAFKFAQLKNELHFITGFGLFQTGVDIFAQIKQHSLILITDIETRGPLDVHQPIVADLPL